MILALRSFLFVKGSRPDRLADRKGREFVKGLPQKLRTGPAHVHALSFAALVANRRDAARRLHLLGALEALPAAAKCRQQSRRQSRPAPGSPSKRAQSSCAAVSCSIWSSNTAMPCSSCRNTATRVSTLVRPGSQIAASLVSATACRMPAMRCSLRCRLWQPCLSKNFRSASGRACWAAASARENPAPRARPNRQTIAALAGSTA